PYSGEDQYDNDAHSSFHWGRKQVYYLNSIQTATHTAYFIKDLRNDAFGKPLSSNEIYETADISQLIIDELGWFHDGIPFLGTIYNYKKQVSLSLNSAVAHKILKLSKIILVRNQDNIILNSASGADLITQQTGNIEIEEKIIAGSDIYSRNIYSESFEMYYSDNILDNNDLSYFNSNNSFTAEEKALRIVEFVHDYSLCLGAPNTSSTTTGRLTLKEVNLLGAGSVQNVPSYRFTYHNSQNFDISKMNKWGYHQDVPYLWNLAQIEAPTGGITIIEYEDDDFVFEAAAYHLDCANTNAQCFGTAAGVRVKKISRQDESGNLYSTLYEYKMHGQNIYSGVISFEPREYFDVIFRTFIPYIYDLPMPRVMYELVKVRKTAANDDSDYETETEYYFEVLQRTENSEKPADDGKHFEMGKQFEVINTQRNLDVDNDGADDASTELIPYDDSDIELKVRGAVIYDNTAVLGRPLFVVTRNKTGDIIGRTGYYYYNRDSLSGGVTQETFNYRKICKANIDADTDIETVKYLNYSSRIKYPSVLEKIVTSENGITSVDTYDKFDLFTGIPVETSSNGVLQKIIPAYKIQEFEEMGSKLSDITNRNMLSQLAARYTMNSDSATTYAGIYTWKKSWGARLPSNGVTAGQLYEEIPPQALPDIWRKHSEFTWDGERNDNGSFKGFCVKDIDGTMLVNKDFIWDATDDVNISNGWIKTLENKRFDKYSHLLETVDASDKHTSFKMDINNVNLAAEAVNANYRSFAAAGFEYYSTISNPLTPLFVVKDYGCEIFDNQNNSWLSSGDDGIIAHSGNHFIRINGGIGPMFYTTIDDKDNNEIRIAPGKYRASVWVHKNSDNGIRLDFSINNICASDIIFNSSDPNRIQIDDWILLNLDFEVPICETGDRIMVYITYYQRDGTLLNGDYSYIDDFRIHPVDASLISYIYDNKGNVSAKLNPVNFAAFFEYDEEFRLKNVIKETIKYGKQKVSDYEYHYAREGSQ
ncbi:MAG: hypothetical protein HY738_17035, partial [Bacteroidia bacterium]|nr:hypothetical protein [Bacteroidia bacterium]